MVHRKSTYKLSFKNLSKDLRKHIWEENSILREKRRINELSHHSLDEIDNYCDCDLKDSDSDDNEDEDGNNNISDEESNDSGRQTDTELDLSTVDCIEERNKTKGDSCVDRRKPKPSKEEKDKSLSALDDERQRRSTKKITEKNRRRKEDLDHFHLNSSRSDDFDKRKTFAHPDFASEANLLNLLKCLRTQEKKGGGGVMKTKATGEYDLIPARLQSVQKETKKKSKSPPLCRRLSSSFDRNILNVRPRTAIVSMPIRSSSAAKKPVLPPRERVTFSDDDIRIAATGSKPELRSSRREPRMKSFSTEHFGTESSLCRRCAQPIKERGILT